MKIVSNRQLKADLWGWLLVSPLVLGLLIFTIYPLGSSIVYSFFDKSMRKMEFVGLQNFIDIFSKESGVIHQEFFHSLWVTFRFTAISVPLGLILGYLLATFLCAHVKGNGFLLVLYYLPALIPAVVSGKLWADMLNEQYGLFNIIIVKLFGGEGIAFTSSKNLLGAYIWLSTFGVGGGSIIWAAGIRSVDKTYYEAASLDGANKFKQFILITLPLTTPYIFYNLIMGLIGSLQQFNGPYILTGDARGGADNALQTVVMCIYDTMFQKDSSGLACAMAWILCMIIGLLTILVFKSSKWVHYGDEE